MKRLTVTTMLVALGFIALVMFAPMAATQPTGWLSFVQQDSAAVVQFRVFGAYGAPGFIGVGTAYPTIANSGQGPMNAELFSVRDNAGANEPVLGYYSNAATAWRTAAVSTLATNAPNVANSVWFGTNQLIFEAATADAFEYIFTPADTTGDVTITLPSDNADWAGTAAPMYSVLLTNAPDAANSLWGVSNGLHFEGATADAFENSLQSADVGQDQVVYFGDYGEAATSAVISTLDGMDIDEATAIWMEANDIWFEGTTANAFEMVITAEDATVGVQTTLIPDRAVADTFYMYNIADGELTTGYFSIPPLFTHTEDVTMTAGANERLIVHRMYLDRPITISDAAVLLIDGGALAAGDIVGVAIYEDADAGAQLTEGTGDGTAAGLEEIALTDVTLFPGYYRFAICTSDDTNMNFAGTLFDDEQIDIIGGIAGDIAHGSGANPCVAGDPPATTGALTTRDVAIPFIYFY